MPRKKTQKSAPAQQPNAPSKGIESAVAELDVSKAESQDKSDVIPAV